MRSNAALFFGIENHETVRYGHFFAYDSYKRRQENSHASASPFINTVGILRAVNHRATFGDVSLFTWLNAIPVSLPRCQSRAWSCAKAISQDRACGKRKCIPGYFAVKEIKLGERIYEDKQSLEESSQVVLTAENSGLSGHALAQPTL